MDLINWGISSLDTIFSQKKTSPAEPHCPPGAMQGGYYYNEYYKKWSLVCIGSLSIEDVEDIAILVLLVIGLVLIGTMLVAIHRKISKFATRSMSDDEDRASALTLSELQQNFQDFGRGSAVSSGILSARWTEILDTLKGLRTDISDLKIAVSRIQEKLN